VESASNVQAERVIEIEAKVDEAIKNQNSTRTLTIVVPEKPVYNAGVAHQEFETLVRLLSLKQNVYLAGPAGSGKTESAHKASDALGLAFYPTSVSQQTSKSDLFGYINPGTGVLVRTPFRNAYENGGVFLLDEIDAGNPNVLVSINSAISNGGASFPDGYVKKHIDFRAVASANTWGYGADRQYVGRNQLDSATLDRFAKVSWDYDESFELAITPNVKWTKHVQALRKSAFTLKERIVISPRASINGAVAIAGGFSWERAERLYIFEGVNPEVEAKIRKGAK
jgi:MoxR-like ATPase